MVGYLVIIAIVYYIYKAVRPHPPGTKQRQRQQPQEKERWFFWWFNDK